MAERRGLSKLQISIRSSVFWAHAAGWNVQGYPEPQRVTIFGDVLKPGVHSVKIFLKFRAERRAHLCVAFAQAYLSPGYALGQSTFVNPNPSKVVHASVNVRHERLEVYLRVIQLLLRRDSDGPRGDDL